MAPEPQHRRSCCPVSCTLDLIGDRWTLLIIRDLFAGKTRYSEFLRSPEGIATNILSDRLNLLAEHSLIERRAASSARRATYHLTETGRSLGTVLRAVAEWGLTHLPDTEAQLAPPNVKLTPNR